MPFLIRDPKLESDLDRHAKSQAVPTSKARMIGAIARTVIETAEAEGATVIRILEELKQRTATRTKQAG